MFTLKNKLFTIIAGVVVVLIGIGYGMQALGYIDHFTIFIKGWWTIFLILPGIIMLFTRGTNKMVSFCLIAIGLALFLRQQGFISTSIKNLILPTAIVLFGLSLIFHAIFGSNRNNHTTFTPSIPEDGSIPDYEVSFGEVNPDYAGKVFEGCSMDITFGSGKLNLRNAIIDKEVTISVNIAFSGVEIKLPAGCKVDLQTSTSFAGVENQYIPSEMPDAPLVHIFASASFGGVEIK